MDTDLIPSQPTYLDTLRNFLRDVPSNAPFAESVRLLSEAFDESFSVNPASWVAKDIEGFFDMGISSGAGLRPPRTWRWKTVAHIDYGLAQDVGFEFAHVELSTWLDFSFEG